MMDSNMTTTSAGSTGPVELDQLQIDFTDNANNDQQVLDININLNHPTTGTTDDINNQTNNLVEVAQRCPDNHSTASEMRRDGEFETGEDGDNCTQNGAGLATDVDESMLSYEDEPEEVRMVIDGLVEESIAAGLAIYVDELNWKNNPDNPVGDKYKDSFEGFDQAPLVDTVSPRQSRVVFKEPSLEDLSDNKSDFSSVSDEDENIQKQDSEAEFEFEVPQISSPQEKTPPAPTTMISVPAISVTLVSASESSTGDQEVDVVSKSEPSIANTESSTTSQLPPSSAPAISVGVESGDIKDVGKTDKADTPAVSKTGTDPVEDDKTKSVDAAQAEWDTVRTVEAGFADDKGKPTTTKHQEEVAPLLNYNYAIHHLEGLDYSEVKGSVKTHITRSGFAALTNFIFGPPKLHRDLLHERELVFCIAASPLDNNDHCHIRMLQTIYRSLTGSYFECQRYGNHWEEIGFQGTDPATDVRGIGMLGLLQLLHLVRDPAKSKLARDIYKLSLDPVQNFPFCIMGLNMTRFTIQALREDLLNRDCNRQGKVMDVVNDFYSGLFLHLFRIWKQGKIISDSGTVLRDVEQFSKKRPRDVVKNLQDYLKGHKVEADPVLTSEEAFLNVCTMEKEEE
ncbi:uncharacterized protein LOC121384662 [Gigantopelta aegis]|uniref:uncharacterized protein LOC121384662 n=1 Tax=Gigantopelta aegis TaxID=1735272 RepID=UPI001B889FCA|nr:uncharacterized protein LOC121384662 [Gigantopelta aegis]